MHQLSLVGPTGDDLHVATAGDKGPVLMLVHGFPLDHRLWLETLCSLSDSFRVIAPEVRGFGRTSFYGESFTLGEVAGDVEFVRSHLARDAKIILCGLSMGGYIAFEYWSRFREHLCGMILCNTKPTSDSPEARQARITMGEVALQRGTWDAARSMIPKLIAAVPRSTSPIDAGDSSVLPEVQSRLEEMIRETPPRTIYAAQTAMAQRADFTARLREIEVPTLVITGEHDTLAPPLPTREWAQQIPGSQVEVLKNAAHLPPLESPSSFNEAVRTFCSSLVNG